MSDDGLQLAAAVAAERDHDAGRGVEAVGGGVGDDQRGERVEDLVDEARVRPDGLLARRAVGVHAFERVEAFGEGGAEELETEAAPILDALGARLGAAGPAIQLGRHRAPSVTSQEEYCQRRRTDTARCSTAALQCADMRRIWRDVIERIIPYEAGHSLEALERGLGPLVRLSANENPLGASPRVVDAIRREAARIHLYPDGGSTAAAGGARPRARRGARSRSSSPTAPTSCSS